MRCRHCYRPEGDAQPLTLENIQAVIDQFCILRKRYNELHGLRKRGHINITGGEPFFRSDIAQILRYLGQKSRELTYGVLTNGSFIDREVILLLKETGVSFVQLSIDGDEKTHDALRCQGDYRRVFDTASLLVKNGIRTYISFTANRENMKYLPKVASECRKRHIHKLWSDRLVPIGRGEALQDISITKEALPTYLCYLRKAQGCRVTQLCYPDTEVSMSRGLQFLDSNDSVYRCAAGRSLITVDEYGKILPCRRMPIPCGDIFSSTLEEVYFSNPVFSDLRKERIPGECLNCKYALLCAGGSKCQSYAKTGDYTHADPACPHAATDNMASKPQ